jgi:hypothetical protein
MLPTPIIIACQVSTIKIPSPLSAFMYIPITVITRTVSLRAMHLQSRELLNTNAGPEMTPKDLRSINGDGCRWLGWARLKALLQRCRPKCCFLAIFPGTAKWSVVNLIQANTVPIQSLWLPAKCNSFNRDEVSLQRHCTQQGSNSACQLSRSDSAAHMTGANKLTTIWAC